MTLDELEKLRLLLREKDQELAFEMYRHAADLLLAVERERIYLRALEDIVIHSQAPFTSIEWVNYTHHVASEALKAALRPPRR